MHPKNSPLGRVSGLSRSVAQVINARAVDLLVHEVPVKVIMNCRINTVDHQMFRALSRSLSTTVRARKALTVASVRARKSLTVAYEKSSIIPIAITAENYGDKAVDLIRLNHRTSVVKKENGWWNMKVYYGTETKNYKNHLQEYHHYNFMKYSELPKAIREVINEDCEEH